MACSRVNFTFYKVNCRSQCSRILRRGFESRREHGCLSRVLCSVLSGGGLPDELITNREVSTECGVFGCDREAWMRRPWPTRDCCAMGGGGGGGKGGLFFFFFFTFAWVFFLQYFFIFLALFFFFIYKYFFFLI